MTLPRTKVRGKNRLKSTFTGLIHKNESFQGLENLYEAPGILISSKRVKRTRIRFRKSSSSSLSLRNPSEGISNAWDSQEIPDCQSQELRLLSGLRDIFLVKVIIDWLNPQRAKPNHEIHIRGTRRWV